MTLTESFYFMSAWKLDFFNFPLLLNINFALKCSWKNSKSTFTWLFRLKSIAIVLFFFNRQKKIFVRTSTTLKNHFRWVSKISHKECNTIMFQCFWVIFSGLNRGKWNQIYIFWHFLHNTKVLSNSNDIFLVLALYNLYL